MIVECPYCESKVSAIEIAHHVGADPEEHDLRQKLSLVNCAQCKNAILVEQINYPGDDPDEWGRPMRRWPMPSRFLPWSIPGIVRLSIEEAERCFTAGAYTACAVMCGRALEGACVDKETKGKTLANGLKELRSSEVIDGRLYRWGEELRKARNLGAHASGERVTKDDASDLLSFTIAIAEYIYVLGKRFEAFMDRQAKLAAQKIAKNKP